jgi:hypothetical protein
MRGTLIGYYIDNNYICYAKLSKISMPVQSLCMGIFYAVSLFNRLYGGLYRSDNLAEIYTKTTVDKDSSSKKR